MEYQGYVRDRHFVRQYVCLMTHVANYGGMCGHVLQKWSAWCVD